MLKRRWENRDWIQAALVASFNWIPSDLSDHWEGHFGSWGGGEKTFLEIKTIKDKIIFCLLL